MAMEGVALQCMQMGEGWGEWASQVEHSSTEEQGCMWECTSICDHTPLASHTLRWRHTRPLPQ
eukprot:3224073-Prymnesium_polylepis.1